MLGLMLAIEKVDHLPSVPVLLLAQSPGRSQVPDGLTAALKYNTLILTRQKTMGPIRRPSIGATATIGQDDIGR